MTNFEGKYGKWSLGGISGRMIKTTQYGGFIADVDTKANALLISKAPDMLDQLNRIHGEIMRSDGVLDVQKWGDQIEKLIKEATEL